MASNRRYSLSRVNQGIDNDEKSAANAKLSSNQGSHPKHRRFSSGDRKHFKVDSPALSVPMDRNSMLLVEANEISQYLQLDYVSILVSMNFERPVLNILAGQIIYLLWCNLTAV